MTDDELVEESERWADLGSRLGEFVDALVERGWHVATTWDRIGNRVSVEVVVVRPAPAE